jgi:methylmalonyl-CoA epimerase
MFKEIDHIGICVANIEDSIKQYTEQLGFTMAARESLDKQGITLAFLSLKGETTVELLGSLRDDSVVAKHLSKRGPGLHHICYRVENISSELIRLEKLGYRLIDKTSRPGAAGSKIAFLHPQSFGGVLVELCQRV